MSIQTGATRANLLTGQSPLLRKRDGAGDGVVGLCVEGFFAGVGGGLDGVFPVAQAREQWRNPGAIGLTPQPFNATALQDAVQPSNVSANRTERRRRR